MNFCPRYCLIKFHCQDVANTSINVEGKLMIAHILFSDKWSSIDIICQGSGVRQDMKRTTKCTRWTCKIFHLISSLACKSALKTLAVGIVSSSTVTAHPTFEECIREKLIVSIYTVLSTFNLIVNFAFVALAKYAQSWYDQNNIDFHFELILIKNL